MARARRFACLAVIGAALVWLFVPWKPSTVRISGDGAPTVEAAMPAALEHSVAALDVVLLRRSENLRHVPEVARLCRGRCDAALTALYEVGPGGGRKYLVFDLAQIGGGQALDRGAPLPDPIAACLVDQIVEEVSALYVRSSAPCLPSHRWMPVLPYGL